MIDLRKLQNQFLVSDPGFQAFRNAVRGTITIVISFLVLSSLAKSLHQAPTLAFVGVFIAMMSALLISDPTIKQQKGTLFALVLPAAFGLSSSIWLAPYPPWRLGAFLIVTFLAVSGRRYGPRATALGFIMFMSYISAMLFPMPIASLPWVLGAVVVALFATYLIRFVVLPDHPRRILRWYLRGFEDQIRGLLQEIAFGVKDVSQLEEVRKRLRAKLIRLNELSLTVEQFLNAGTSHSLKTESEALHLSLFERELNLRKLIDSVRELIPLGSRIPWLELSGKIEAVLEHRPLNEDEVALTYPVFWQALKRVEKDLYEPMASAERLQLVEQELHDERKAEIVSKASFQGLHVSTKQAIQATLATGVASVLGSALSPERWYWASITAFVVFAGTSRGDTITRAIFRIAGTFLGLIVGAAIAFGLKGSHGLEWGAIIGFIFLGIFGAKMAFGFFSAFSFTLMLAVLYDLMGLLTTGLLFLRLEETALGALVGAAVSIVVLPTSTRGSARLAIAKLLRTMSEITQKLPLENPDMNARKDLVSSLRLMDRDILNLRTTAAPLVRNWSFLRRAEIPLAVHDLTTLAAYLRHLATNTVSASDEARVKERCLEISKDLQFLAKKIELNQSISLPSNPESSAIGHPFLDRISQLLVEFSTRKV